MRPPPYIVGVNDDLFTLTQSSADRNYLCPSAATREFVDMASAIVVRERLNVVMPTDDESVKALSDHRTRFAIGLFLPRRGTIDLCQDKYALSVRLRQRGVPAPPTYALRSAQGPRPHLRPPWRMALSGAGRVAAPARGERQRWPASPRHGRDQPRTDLRGAR
jgi:hypothetical protein